MEGYLKKRGKGAIASLKKRWCVVQGTQFVYYKTKEDISKGKSIDLVTGDAAIHPHLPFGFDIATPTRTYQFQAATDPERAQWIKEIRSHRNPNAPNAVVNPNAEVVYTVQCQAAKVNGKDNIPADLYITIHSSSSTDAPGAKTLLYRSEVVAQNANPTFQPFELDPARLGGMDANFEISCHELSHNNTSTLLGAVSTKLRAFVAPGAKFSFSGQTKTGELIVASAISKPKTEVTQIPKAITLRAKAIGVEANASGTCNPYLVFKATPKTSTSNQARRPVVVQRTEVINNNNPVWQPFTLEMDICGGLDTVVTVECYEMHETNKHDLIGQCNLTLRELVVGRAPQYYLTNVAKSRPGYRNSGTLMLEVVSKLNAAPYVAPLATYELRFSGKAFNLGLPSFGWGKIDSFFVVKASPYIYDSHPYHPSGARSTSTTVYKSEVVYKDVNPNWAPFRLTVNSCGGLESPLTIDVYDSDDGVGRLFGSVTTSLRELICPHPVLVLYHTIQYNYTNLYSGQLVIEESDLVPDDPNPPLRPVAYTFTCSLEIEKAASLLGIMTSATQIIIKAMPYDGVNSTIYTSEFSKGPWTFDLEVAQTGGMDGVVTIELTHIDTTNAHEVIGSLTTSLREMTLRANPSLPFINKNRNNKNAGILTVDAVEEHRPQPGFEPQQYNLPTQPVAIPQPSQQVYPNISSLSISPNAHSQPQRSPSPNPPSPNHYQPQYQVPPPNQPGLYPSVALQAHPSQVPGQSNFIRPQANLSIQGRNYVPGYQNPTVPPSYHQQQQQQQYPQISVQPPQNSAHLSPYQGQEFLSTSPTGPSIMSSAMPRPNLSPQHQPSLTIQGDTTSLRTSGTGQSPSQGGGGGLRTSATGQQFPSTGNSSTSPLRTSAQGHSPKKHEGQSGGLALANSVATAVATPFFYGIR